MKKRHNRNQKGQKGGKGEAKTQITFYYFIQKLLYICSTSPFHNMNVFITKAVEISNKCSFEGCDGREGDQIGGKAREMVWPDRTAEQLRTNANSCRGNITPTREIKHQQRTVPFRFH